VVNKLLNLIDKRVLTILVATSIILLFYWHIFFYIYLSGLFIFIFIYFVGGFSNANLFKKILKNILIGVGIAFIITVIIESCLQIIPHSVVHIEKFDTLGEFSDYISRNYLTDDVFNKRQGVIRILGLGDSFAVKGRQEGKNYHNFLQEKYRAQGREDVEIVNAGMEAIGPGYYWHILNKYGEAFKPDVVLVGFFVGNDFLEDNLDIIIGNFIREPHDVTKRISRYYTFRQLRMYILLSSKFNEYIDKRKKQQESVNASPEQSGSFSQDTFLEIERDRSLIFDINKRRWFYDKWHRCSELIMKITNWCDQRGIMIVIAILPDQFQVEDKLRENVLNKYKHIQRKDIDLNFPNDTIVDFCKSNKIGCVDLLKPFQEKGKTLNLYELHDTHWNEAGNRLAAELIFKYLEANQLVPIRLR
jgi:hypothetical protein